MLDYKTSAIDHIFYQDAIAGQTALLEQIQTLLHSAIYN